MAKAPKRRDYHHGDLRRALLDASLACIAEHGEKEFTLRDVARRVGVAPSAPYRHFADKDALLTAIAAECAERLGAAMDQATAEADEQQPLDRFRRAGIAYVRFAVENPAHFRVLNMPSVASQESLRANIEEWITEEVARLRAAQSRGELADLPVEDILLASRVLTYGLARLIVDGQSGMGEVDVATAIDLAERVTNVMGLGLLPRANVQPGRPKKFSAKKS